MTALKTHILRLLSGLVHHDCTQYTALIVVNRENEQKRKTCDSINWSTMYERNLKAVEHSDFNASSVAVVKSPYCHSELVNCRRYNNIHSLVIWSNYKHFTWLGRTACVIWMVVIVTFGKYSGIRILSITLFIVWRLLSLLFDAPVTLSSMYCRNTFVRI